MEVKGDSTVLFPLHMLQPGVFVHSQTLRWTFSLIQQNRVVAKEVPAAL